MSCMANVEKMLWKQKPEIDSIHAVVKNTLFGHLGIALTEIGDDFITATMPVDERTMQPMGLLHGGASVVLSESVGSMASWLVVMGEDKNVVGIEVNANHVRAVRTGPVSSITRPVKIGSTLHVWETQIFDAQGRLACTSRLTVMVMPAERQQNSHSELTRQKNSN